MVLRALTLGPLVRLGRGAFSAHSFGDDRRRACPAAPLDPVGTAGAPADSSAGRLPWCPSPAILEAPMSVGKRKTPNARTLQQPLQPRPSAPIVNAPARRDPPPNTA